ncbi:MAG: LysR family transcriptional regulator [Bacillota bacterium]|uniref:DNA-binding transcriptional regulator, LysR family n=1 Tax=[Clostridium] aminophilum TaxID=1526 RepID=A0A1I6IDC3_9FIRM|nr:LysR family transcriptional regulator [[Clostridium] aminophilum]MCR4629524.1 LysR family transcriptional regulator [Clostridium sp.]MDT3844539.1 LysR family transcriptional regulator [Bacillota bacterium]SFR64732.1 DNA-binding transcriptional regulator, LysR family [[Clostridium] aminophilum]
MDTARYKAFLAAAKTGSFSGAALEMDYTTSAVSQLIAALEEELQVPLFHRSRTGVRLTTNGERLYLPILGLVRQEERIYEISAEISGLLTGEILISAYPSICATWLPSLIGEFRKRYPSIHIRIDDSIRQHVVDALKEEKADIGFLSNQHDFSGEFFLLDQNPIVAVVSKNSPYNSLGYFPLKECEVAPLIQSSYGKDKDLDGIYSKYHLHPNITFETRNSYTAAAMVANDMGVLLVNELSTHVWDMDVNVLPLDPPQSISLGMVISPTAVSSPAVKAFASFVKENFKRAESRYSEC